MARAVLGPLLTDLRGKVGDSVFDNYKGIHIVRSMPSVITNPQSEHQTLARAGMTAFVTAWKGLSLAQKQSWEHIAAQMITGQESQGKRDRGCLIPVSRGPFSAYNAFVSCNMNRYSSGLAGLDEVLETPPTSIVLPEPLKSFSATVDGRTITAAWEYINPGPRDERLEIWIRSTGAHIHRQLLYTEDRDADGDTDICLVRGRFGEWLCVPNGVYSLQARIVNEFGLTTAPSELAFVQIGGEDLITYLAARVLVLEDLNRTTDLDWTVLDLSAVVPAGAHTALVFMDLVTDSVAGPVTPTYLSMRRDVTQGEIFRHSYEPITGGLQGDGHGMPLTPARGCEYKIEVTGTVQVDSRIYVYGYIE